MRGEEKMSKCIFVSVASLLVSTLSELKMFFILFILILFMASFMTAHSIKKTLFFVFGAVLVVLFSTLLTVLYKDFTDFLSFDSLIKALTDTDMRPMRTLADLPPCPLSRRDFCPAFSESCSA